MKTILVQLDCLARIAHQAHVFPMLYKGRDSKPKKTTETAFCESVN